ncbi:hypothetical protein MAPG_01442 [Magnaporthiopsis poae ATCC 64411]|uniref:Uncharacterized protein n=1 Tax=Magnaporthiopsis poae (strain ATCC 64411 / 73-15) TaxID=644358 RepID=A0A0C4DNP8_MAGP6|nr:hypothetical protein MAPG_01442 [Magnaporthiopsis poae ATCC 64411]
MGRITVEEDEILQRFDHLVGSGVVLYDNREVVPFSKDGFHFLFFVAPSLSKKPLTHGGQTDPPNGNDSSGQGEEKATATTNAAVEEPPPQRLFEPGSDISTVGFEICDVGAAHRLVANKFCFTRPMLLLMTRDGFKRQHDPLEAPDLAAAWAVLRAMRTSHFVFYNCGEPSGNSRLHRHVQLTRRPEGFTTFLDHGDGEQQPSVPFMYFREPLMRKGKEEEEGRSTPVTGESLAKVYGKLLDRVEAASSFRWDGPGTSCPHNLVMTQHWMAVIPRRRAVWEGLSTNALGMLGLVGVASREEADKWIRVGPLEVLGQFGIPRGS